MELRDQRVASAYTQHILSQDQEESYAALSPEFLQRFLSTN
jgi:hypothetical protein